MGKFKMESIRGFGESSQEEKNQIPEERYMLGDELLSEESRAIVKMKIANIAREKIVKNPENSYSIGGIDGLTESIKNYGLGEPLNVKRLDDGKYMLLGGERRLTAIDRLVADENVKDWNEDTLIPCVIKNPKDIKLPLSDENKEKYSIITTNKEQRKYTDGDRLKEMRAWKAIINELRANGVEYISGENSDGEEEEIKIKGEKTMDILVNTTGMSRGQIQRFDKVEKKAQPEIVDAMLGDYISVGVAEKAVEMLEANEQKKLAKEAIEKQILPADVTTYAKAERNVEVTPEQFETDMKAIRNAAMNNSTYFTKKEDKEYHRIIKMLTRLFVDNNEEE